MRYRAVLAAGGLALSQSAYSATCAYMLTNAVGQPGSGWVTIVDEYVTIEFEGANPNALYTVWIDYRNRATDELADDYPLAEGAIPRGVAPMFATTAGVTSGMGFDPNSIVTDDHGDAVLDLRLDYELLRPGDSPVVGEMLAMQGQNRVGGGWLRVYPQAPRLAASLQTVDPRTGLPLVQRSTAQGLTIVVHPDLVSHGHTPGVGEVDHFPAFSGDFPAECLRPPVAPLQAAVSGQADRSASTSMEGRTLSGYAFVFVSPLGTTGEVEKVDFFIDGKFVHTEHLAPFDLVGTLDNERVAKAFDTRVLSNGRHALSARLTMAAGGVKFIESSFRVDNDVRDLRLSVSESGNRLRAIPLDGARLEGKVYVFVTPLQPEIAVERVDFYLDGHFIKSETSPPYDLMGTTDSGPAPLDTDRLARGQHTLAAVVVRKGGRVSHHRLSDNFYH